VANLDDIKNSNDELIRVMRELVEEERQKATREAAQAILSTGTNILPPELQRAVAAAQSGLSGEAANALGGAGGAGGAFWNQRATEAIGAIGNPLSILQQAMSSSGLGGAATVVGGLAGGVPGMIGAAAQISGQVIGASIGPASAGADARFKSIADADPFLSDEFVNEMGYRHGLEAQQRAGMDSSVQKVKAGIQGVRKYGDQIDPATGRTYTAGAASARGLVDFEQKAAADLRHAERLNLEIENIENGTAAAIKSFFAPLAAGGSSASKSDIEAMLPYFKSREEALFKQNADIDRIVSDSMISPGRHAQQNNK
jgi:hypothetical protein